MDRSRRGVHRVALQRPRSFVTRDRDLTGANARAGNVLRIHRSRIVRKSSILELRSIDNREFTVRLSDGTEHRSSRTYADSLEGWLSSEKG